MKNKAEDGLFNKEDLIYSYTREDAIDDGLLFNISEFAIQRGFTVPCAISCDLFHSYLENGQDEVERIFNMLSAYMYYSRDNKENTIIFPVLFQLKYEVEQVIVKAVIGPGDHGEAVLTFMRSDED